MLTSLAAHYDFSIDTPFADLPQEIQDRVLYGSGRERIAFTYVSERGT
ncbi:MAG: hypothetical protein LBB51_04405, partial [Zoogloeaceae bacterium]|nr:hypothetical protein [Zoogloeaceae bacterium]